MASMGAGPSIEDSFEDIHLASAANRSRARPEIRGPREHAVAAADVEESRLGSETSKGVPPGGKRGARFQSTTGQFKAPRRRLPEPKYGPRDMSLIPAGATWSDDTRAPEVKVDYNATVYKTKQKTYLIVRAKITSYVQLAHDTQRHCGYFQESLRFWMQAPGTMEITPQTFLSCGTDGFGFERPSMIWTVPDQVFEKEESSTFWMQHPGEVEPRPATLPLPGLDPEAFITEIIEKEETNVNVDSSASTQASAGGPMAGFQNNTGRTQIREKFEKREYKTDRVDLALQTYPGKLDWTWTVIRMGNGSSYRRRAVKGTCLGGLPTFARTSSLLEVQGTWSFPRDAEDTVILRAWVGQTLSYDAALKRPFWKGGCFGRRTCVNSPQNEGGWENIRISLKLPDCSAKVNDLMKKGEKYGSPVGKTEESEPEDTQGGMGVHDQDVLPTEGARPVKVSAPRQPTVERASNNEEAFHALPKRRYDVFISHPGTIKELALELKHDLDSLGFNAFVDETALHPGDDADRKMVESAKLAPIGLVLFTKDFVNRNWPMAELKLIVEAGTLLPVAVGMSHTEFEEAWQASDVAAAQFDAALFKKVARTTFVMPDRSGRERPLREKICFSVLRVFVEKIYPRLPDTARSMNHMLRALTAGQRILMDALPSLSGGDYREAKHWVRHLENIRDEYLPFGAPLPEKG